ncbi:hypothetical protein WK43_08235 [Burkholderia ubonensis]|nr:hypothetical protein WK37_19300 [Burkholderia ubonensis]KVS48112.1 hypothetical protein WK38_20305 [Burkholderia ubonensis]KVS95028.1 hypothetical protein WK43_08235 [Burkholderia ubonensis]KVT27736.1 hypothetical protein WK49_07695 [Burkholderia ubonensis]ODQ22045.1 hypothetical protein BGV65_32510 [Burkholderia ubonensis]
MQIDDARVMPITVNKRRKLPRVQCRELLETINQSLAYFARKSILDNSHTIANQILNVRTDIVSKRRQNLVDQDRIHEPRTRL